MREAKRGGRWAQGGVANQAVQGLAENAEPLAFLM